MDSNMGDALLESNEALVLEVWIRCIPLKMCGPALHTEKPLVSHANFQVLPIQAMVWNLRNEMLVSGLLLRPLWT